MQTPLFAIDLTGWQLQSQLNDDIINISFSTTDSFSILKDGKCWVPQRQKLSPKRKNFRKKYEHAHIHIQSKIRKKKKKEIKHDLKNNFVLPLQYDKYKNVGKHIQCYSSVTSMGGCSQCIHNTASISIRKKSCLCFRHIAKHILHTCRTS